MIVGKEQKMREEEYNIEYNNSNITPHEQDSNNSSTF
jgi:hypothetical protein